MNHARHSEGAFETVIETTLLDNGYVGQPAEGFDRDRAIFPETVLDFIRSTQPKEWKALEALHGEKTGAQILTDLTKWMDREGSLATLRHGFKCYGKTLRVAFFKAAHALNPELEARYAANRVGITRQLHFSKTSEKSLDVALSVNGIPVASVELKNPMTGQTVDNALRQYRNDRDPREPIFEFKRRGSRVPPPTSYLSTRAMTVARAIRLTQRAEAIGPRICGKRFCGVTACWTCWSVSSTCRSRRNATIKAERSRERR
jgi:type I restriction enzyme R subunit